jgi:hypothetical protein
MSGFRGRKASGKDDAAARSRVGPLCQAIRQTKLVFANHKKKTLLLAPYGVVCRDEELLLDAVIVLEDGRAPGAPSLSSFALADLIAVARSEQDFTPDPQFYADSLGAAETIVCMAAAGTDS